MAFGDKDNGIEELLTGYFENLYQSEGSSSEEILKNIQPSVSEIDNAMLIAPFIEKEIQEAVFSMHPDKASGPVGMNPAFF